MATRDDVITAPIGEFCRIAGIGPTKTYELLKSGEIESITVGKRRLIVLASWHRFVARQLGEKPGARPEGWTPPRPQARPAAA